MLRSRFRRQASGQGHVELNVIPLIDVVFFLLVFYVISTSFEHLETVSIDRPTSTQSTRIEQAFVAVAVVKSGAVHIGSEVVDLRFIADSVRLALDRSATDRVVLIADREVPTGLLLAVMDACRAGGAANVDVAADRDTGP